jgi:hypothetical protein
LPTDLPHYEGGGGEDQAEGEGDGAAEAGDGNPLPAPAGVGVGVGVDPGVGVGVAGPGAGAMPPDLPDGDHDRAGWQEAWGAHMEDVIYEQHVREDNDAGVPRMDPGVPNWTTEATGAALKGGKTARYFFMLIFPLVLFERMAQATNLEGQRRYDGVTAGGNRRRPWVAMTVSHALVFVAMLVMMGVHAFSDMAHYWNTTHPALGARKAFRRLMSRTRFMRIHASLRFCTEDERPQVRLDLSPVFPCGMPTCSPCCRWIVCRWTPRTLRTTGPGNLGTSCGRCRRTSASS